MSTNIDILTTDSTPDHKSLGDIILEVKERSTEILLYLWNQDYSSLENGFFGITFIDVLGFFMALFVIYEIFKYVANMAGNILTITGKTLFTYIANYSLVFFQVAVSRVKRTVIYIWNIEYMRKLRFLLGARIQKLLTGFQQ